MEDFIHDQFTHVPERISGLVDLAYNLWWSWNPEAQVLFKQVNRKPGRRASITRSGCSAKYLLRS